ncbi:MAG: hypothetical protein HYU69_07195 [Bacteroidetes bacterium]|nr:hypothetical protein [Bacteroidota bacterium]
MKRNSDSLFHLIKSMNKSEKRYFKLYSVAFKKDTQIIKLYDIIEKLIDYTNEGKVFLEFKSICKGKDFYGTKKKLYEQLMRSLRIYHSGISAENLINSYIHNTQLLLQKRLFDECAVELEKAILLAKEGEFFLLLLQTFEIEARMNLGKELPEQEIIQKEAAKEEAILKYRNYSKYLSLESAFAAMYYKHSFIRNEQTEFIYSEIISDHFIKDSSMALSARSRMIRSNILCSYYFAKCDFENGYLQAKNVMLEIESRPGFETLFQRKYVSAIGNAIKCLLYLRQYDKMKIIIDKLKLVKPVDKDIAIRKFELKTVEVSALLDVGDFKAALAMIPQMEEELKIYFGKVEMKNHVIILFHAALANFGLEKYSESIKWLNRLLHLPGAEKNSDIYYFAQLINLILHYEKSNIEHVEYKMRGIYKYFYTRPSSLKFESLILQLIKEAIYVNDQKELIALFVNYKIKLEHVLKDPFEKIAIEYFDIISWLESKITGKSFAEVIKLKWKKV